MKIAFIIIGIILLVGGAIQAYMYKSQKDIEQYSYTLVKSYKDFEVRDYKGGLFTSVQLPTNTYEKASNKGFSILAGYIFGSNEKNEKIAMTSPVSMSLDDSITMMFMVPAKYSKDQLPKPNQGDIKIVELPAKKIAAIRFGGWANSEKIELYKNKLKAALAAEGISHNNKFSFLGYNPPFELFNRRNEVIVELN